MSIQAGAHCLEKEPGGAGILIGGVPGVAPAKVVIIGGGVVGENAAYMAIGLGADVTVIERNVDTMRALVVRFGGRIKTLYSTALTIEGSARCRSGDRRRSGSRRQGPEAREPRSGLAHAPRLRPCRRGNRSGRVL